MNLEDILNNNDLPEKIELSQQDLKKLIIEYKGLKNVLESERTTWFNVNQDLEKAYLELGEKEKEIKNKNKILKDDIEIARRIQSSIVNKEFESIGNDFKVAFYYNPVGEVGGDLFDILKVGERKIGFLMSDISGTGVSAALISTLAKVCFNIHNRELFSTGEVIEQVNADLFKFIGDLNHYVSAFYAVLDLDTNEFQYSNAGHFPALIINKHEGVKTLDHCKGTFLGLIEKGFWDSKTIELEPGDRILLYTDGIVESRNSYNEIYDSKRLIDFANINRALGLKEFINELVDDVSNFSGEMPQLDDVALLLIEYIKEKV